MKPPHLTVVIPTRNRCTTLVPCLQTCVTQDYPNLTILVSDNDSSDGTREVVSAINDPRLRYVNTGCFVSMSDNWEFALSHVEEGFVTYLGDDDGLLPGAVTDIAALLAKSDFRAVAWMKAEYHWPSHASPSLRNIVQIPTDNVLIEVNAATALRDSCRLWLPYNKLPCVYNGAIELGALRAVLGNSGRFFESVTPDVYSGYALLSVLDRYLFSTRPFSVNGASGASNGSAFSSGALGHGVPLAPLYADRAVSEHPVYRVIPGVIYSVVLEALAKANDICFGGRLKLPARQAIRRTLSEVSRRPAMQRAAFISALEQIRQLAERIGQIGYYSKMMSRYGLPRAETLDPDVAPMPRVLVEGGYLNVCVSGLPIVNIADAAIFIGAQLGCYCRPLRPLRYSFTLLVASSRLADFTLVRLFAQIRQKLGRI